MPAVLVVGASRGIGRELAKQYRDDGWTVHATRRERAEGDDASDIVWHPVDVREEASIDRLARDLEGVPLDLVLLCAGVMGPRDMTPEAIDRQTWAEVFAVNTMAPLALAGALRPHLRSGGQRKLVALTSRLGSMGANDRGSLYIYRSTKAGLNACWKSLSIDTREDGLICTLVHPGWVRTDMGGPSGEISVEESVTGLRALIAGLTPAHSGRFFNYDGTELPW